MRADALGLSGMLTASTPTDFRNREPSNSLRISVPLGGTTSTMVTNSPCAHFAPRGDRSSRDCAGAGLGGAAPPTTWAEATLPLASPTRRADFITRMWSGVVPQHPPTILAPAATNLRA